MRKLMNFLRGMVILRLTGPFPERLINLCAQAGIDFWAMEWLDEHTVRLTTRRYTLRRFKELARKAGIGEERIILDPGVGFAKSYEQNLCAIRQVGELRELGYPVLLGTSRKSVIGLTLDLPANQRVEGTLATTVIGVTQGCSFVRVHDVAENVRAIAMTEAVLYARK